MSSRVLALAALDAPRDLTGVKTHFLRLEVRDGAFHLGSRQHDGFTGLASPGVRRQSTRSPELVGRLAGIMLDRDFGLAGTAEPIADKDKPNEALVRIRGGQLGPLERFVKVGDVFAVSQLQRTNRPAPPPARTATGKVIAPPPGSVPPEGFTAAARDNLDFRDGLFRSSHPLPGVACVVIAVGPGKAERFPLPVLGGEPVTLRFELDPKAEERAVFERACLALAGQAADARLAQAACFEAVAKLIAGRNNTDALARAKPGHKTATEADRQISDELPRLKEQLSKSPNAGRLLDSVADQLARLRQGNEQLAGSIR